MNTPTLVVAGHICLDVYPDLGQQARRPFEQTVLPGRLIVAGPVTFYTGGTVANVGLSLHRLGIPTRLVGKLGDDLFGQQILTILKSFGEELAGGMIVEPGANTSYSIVINYPGADRIFFHCPGANDAFVADDIPYAALQEASLFHFGYPPLMKATYQNDGEQLTEIFRRARQTGVTTSLDMAFPNPGSEAASADWRKILQATLPWVDIFLPSIEETLLMLRPQQFHEMNQAAGLQGIIPLLTPSLLSDIAAELLDMGAKIVVLKLGARGLYLRTSDVSVLGGLGRARPNDLTLWSRREAWAPCFQVEVIGTTGSGDATIAGFLAAFLRGLDPASTLTMAVAVGACNVEAADAISGIRSWEATRERIKSGWARRPLQLDERAWTIDPASGHWLGPAEK